MAPWNRNSVSNKVSRCHRNGKHLEKNAQPFFPVRIEAGRCQAQFVTPQGSQICEGLRVFNSDQELYTDPCQPTPLEYTQVGAD